MCSIINCRVALKDLMGSTRILEETNSIEGAMMCCRVDGLLGREDTISSSKTQHCNILEGTLQSLGRVL